MSDVFQFLNANSGALSVIFTAAVTLATVGYAVLTAVLVRETRLMREAQTEPRIEITVNSFEIAVNFIRLNVRNIGSGPALGVSFNPRVVEGGDSAESLLKDFTEINFFDAGLSYLGPGQGRVSSFSKLTGDYEGKIHSVLIFEVQYTSLTGKRYRNDLVVDMRELKGIYQLGKPHLYAIAQSMDKIQKDLNRLASGARRIQADVYTSQDRQLEEIERERERAEMREEYARMKDDNLSQSQLSERSE